MQTKLAKRAGADVWDVEVDAEWIGSVEHLGRAQWSARNTDGEPVGPFQARSKNLAVAFVRQAAGKIA